jgi:RsiW-degrading membrane proteinase PrsW (M82 family)
MLHCALHDQCITHNYLIMEQLTLTAKLKKPLTPAEWLRSSMSWALASVLGCLLLSGIISKLLAISEMWTNWLLLGTAAVAHLLIWYKSVLTTWETVAEHTEPLWLSVFSAAWTLVLILFQLSCLALLFLAAMLTCDGGKSSGWSF